ncbi:MAG: hypothetical protein ACTSPI_00480 [Candidatus Heimdallarchaeaceae archaeon]
MEMTEENSSYIGDGVYAGFDGMNIWLYTGSHDYPDNRVCLEPEVLDSLIHFVKRVGFKI